MGNSMDESAALDAANSVAVRFPLPLTPSVVLPCPRNIYQEINIFQELCQVLVPNSKQDRRRERLSLHHPCPRVLGSLEATQNALATPECGPFAIQRSDGLPQGSCGLNTLVSVLTPHNRVVETLWRRPGTVESDTVYHA